MNRSQRGFTLLELLAALGAAGVAGFVLLAIVTSVLHWNATFSERERSEAALDAFADRLQSEEDSAWAIFTSVDGRELHFFRRDSQNRAHFWAYRYDAAAQTLQRVLYGAPGGAEVADGAPLSRITSFFAQTAPVTALQDPSSPLYSGLYENAALTPAAVSFGFETAPQIAGGNQLTYVRMSSAHAARTFVLSTQTAPSGFTIVLRYTPSPGPVPQTSLSAAIASSSVIGHWEDCPDPSKDCSNAEWPQYHWAQTIASRFYKSTDGGYTWTLFDTSKTVTTGVSGPAGGDLPDGSCAIDRPVDYARACSPDWSPSAPPGVSGMDLTP